MKLSPFICQLLATQCGRDLRYSADCDFLALDIESKTGEHIGVNTMKRLLGQASACPNCSCPTDNLLNSGRTV